MKIGLVARSEARGLGNLTFEFFAHMHPERVLLVVPNHRIAQRLDRYPDATVLRWDHHRDSTLDEQVVRAWLDGLDCVYSAETFYDWRFCDWARDAGVRTVVHVMPEYYRHATTPGLPKPDAWWTPTRWRLETLDRATRVVPVPIALERFAPPTFHVEQPLRSLHPGGAAAAGDRNGTRLVIGALRYLVRGHVVTIRTQGDQIPRGHPGPNVQVFASSEEVGEYWEMYGDADLLVLPRRYAGLSLPALEAMAAGLAVLMSDIEPQHSEWPISPLRAAQRGFVRTGAGNIPSWEVTPRTLAARMDWLADHPEEVRALQRQSYAFAETQSWEALRPMIVAELERVCG